ncbi:hypothetical protein TH66_23200 [Carbonactinospora thermoautotrophica]|uniref:Oxygen sensor histidine kinase NreB n=1 Tax=Carbonactinospora thermoautotrophica TaxID=1469144 RepID=A0A132NIQ9_9ACTN|nr:GAF domain-containing protein [Carbonactinospora thermoautotrophica]KWW98155.1 hypothetical protein TH66_23200 [Carbonactinospora thermoautotrophica]KWX09974.1 hypothetical protein TR74_06420 [Carbonactinospora thermoautotrophica]
MSRLNGQAGETGAWPPATGSGPRATALDSELDPAVIAARVSRELALACQVDVAFLAIHDVPGVLHVRGTFGARTPGLRKLEIPSGVGLGGQVLLSHRSLKVWDYATDDSISHELAGVVAIGEGIGGLAGVPVTVAGRMLGVLYTGLRGPGDLGDQRVRLMETYASRLSDLLLPAVRVGEMVRQSVLAERQRIAVELHDTIGQLLFSIGASARAALTDAADDDPHAAERWRDVERQASRAASLLRDALHALCPPTDTDAFLTAVRADMDEFTERTGIPASLINAGGLTELPPEVASALARAVRVALHNVEKHARASSVVVSAWQEADAVVVAVQDDGVGPPDDLGFAAVLTSGSPGLGLTALGQRLERLGGDLAVFRNDDGGTTLRARVPLPARLPRLEQAE